jgi:hypothetical protein
MEMKDAMSDDLTDEARNAMRGEAWAEFGFQIWGFNGRRYAGGRSRKDDPSWNWEFRHVTLKKFENLHLHR